MPTKPRVIRATILTGKAEVPFDQVKDRREPAPLVIHRLPTARPVVGVMGRVVQGNSNGGPRRGA